MKKAEGTARSRESDRISNDCVGRHWVKLTSIGKYYTLQIGKKTLDFFLGGGRMKLVSELGKRNRKGVMVFKGKRFKVLEAIDGRGLTYVGKLFEQFEVFLMKKGAKKHQAKRDRATQIGLIDIGCAQ